MALDPVEKFDLAERGDFVVKDLEVNGVLDLLDSFLLVGTFGIGIIWTMNFMRNGYKKYFDTHGTRHTAHGTDTARHTAHDLTTQERTRTHTHRERETQKRQYKK